MEVGARGQEPATVAAGGDHRHALGLGGIVGTIKLLPGELEQQPDQLVLHEAQALRAQSPVALLAQHAFRRRPALRLHALDILRYRAAQLTLATPPNAACPL